MSTGLVDAYRVAESFGVAMATATNFSGASAFDLRTPTSDLVRCLP